MQFARAAGDVAESAWTQLGPFGQLLQKMTLLHRQMWLDLIIKRYNTSKAEGLPKMLVRMFWRAWVELQTAREQIDDLGQIMTSEYTAEQVKEGACHLDMCLALQPAMPCGL